jgi:hypothetical protein
MLALFTKNGRVIQGTGVTFALVGTSMHILNVINLMPSPISHTWSTLAIAGFFLTSSSQISNGLGKFGGLKKRQKKQVTNIAYPQE